MSTLTASQENYLEHIYRLAEAGPVRVRDLARSLGVRLPSVSRAVTGLAKAGLVEHESYGAIELTPEGRAIGREIVRRDEALTTLLVAVLGMELEEADPLVHQIEHVVSEELMLRLEALSDAALASPDFMRRLDAAVETARASHREREAANERAQRPTERIGRSALHAGRRHEKLRRQTARAS